ncbi:MAG: hypothetical protein ACE5H3_12970, partial [Planctomycetota bacterium]
VESGKASLPGKMRPAYPLTRLERILVGVLRRNGNVMHLQDLKEKCLPRGLKSSTLAIFLAYSPLVERQGCCVYSLRGFPADSRRIKRLLARESRRRRARKR